MRNVRDEAVEFLLAMYDADVRFDEGKKLCCPSRVALKLAEDAWNAAYSVRKKDEWLEGAGLLLDGWEPGDPVRLIPR